MRARRLIRVPLLTAGLTALGAFPALARDYSASISGQQTVRWAVNGSSGDCEIRHGEGSGRVSFRFASRRAVPVSAIARGRGMVFGTSIPSAATGSIEGTFSDTLERACEGFGPGGPFTSPAGGCGSTRFGIRVDFGYRSDGFVYVTGPSAPTGPVSLAQLGGACPFLESLESNDLSSCGDGRQLWKRSWGIAAARGEGLLASRFTVKPGALLRPRKRKIVLTGRAAVDCTVPSTYTRGVKITGSLTYALTLKRR